jgi:hypothetical protein
VPGQWRPEVQRPIKGQISRHLCSHNVLNEVGLGAPKNPQGPK